MRASKPLFSASSISDLESRIMKEIERDVREDDASAGVWGHKVTAPRQAGAIICRRCTPKTHSAEGDGRPSDQCAPSASGKSPAFRFFVRRAMRSTITYSAGIGRCRDRCREHSRRHRAENPRDAAPAPVAIQSGTQPRMKANEAMRIDGVAGGAAAPRADETPPLESPREFDDQDRILRGQSDQHDESDLP
jgi:hypothetical protein